MSTGRALCLWIFKGEALLSMFCLRRDRSRSFSISFSANLTDKLRRQWRAKNNDCMIFQRGRSSSWKPMIRISDESGILWWMCFLSQVFVGSASDGVLEAGDRLLTINNQPTEGITHVEAQNIFRYSTTIIMTTMTTVIMMLIKVKTRWQETHGGKQRQWCWWKWCW